MNLKEFKKERMKRQLANDLLGTPLECMIKLLDNERIFHLMNSIESIDSKQNIVNIKLFPKTTL